MDNLGSHLLAVRAYAAPISALQEILCRCEQPDERCVWLEKRNTRGAFLDLLANKERIIQRLTAKVETSLDGEDFLVDLQFAFRVAKDAAALS
ncbi:MAG TPA: hypothetical protein VJW94_08615 [Candidatus Acidoferrum sp.]|nr:hypothetical protein [Candidatus Acidoferrum sp.]